MKIFGIGLNKTGTVSLHAALQILGYKSLHDHIRLRDMVKDLDHPDWSNYDCFLDLPGPPPFRALASKFPDSKFILTTRDSNDWICSRLIHVLYNRRIGGDWVTLDVVKNLDLFERHHQDARAYFADKTNYIEFDVSAGDGWAKLCGFLGVPIPPDEYPRRNTGENKLRKILESYDSEPKQ